MYRFSINMIVNSLDEFKLILKELEDIDDFSCAEVIFYDCTNNDSFSKYYQTHSLPFTRYINTKKLDIATIYNKAIEESRGDYLNFTSTDVKYSHDYIYKLEYYLNNNHTNVISFTNKDNSLNIQSSLEGYFFNREIIGYTRFSNDIDNFKLKFILDILLKNENYSLIKSIKFKTNKINYLVDKGYYLNELNDFYLKFLKNTKSIYNCIPKLFQEIFFELLLERYLFNIDNYDSYILSSKEEKKFITLTTKVLDYIDSDIILNNSLKERWLLYYLYNLKNSNNSSDKLLFTITNLDYFNNEIIIDGYLDNIYNSNFKIYSNNINYNFTKVDSINHKLFSFDVVQDVYRTNIPISDNILYLHEDSTKNNISLYSDDVFFKKDDIIILVEKDNIKILKNNFYNLLKGKLKKMIACGGTLL